MVFYSSDQAERYQGRNLDPAYHRLAHRHRMKLGITLWGFGLGYREAVDLAPRVEEAGFHNLFMSTLEAIAALSAVA